MKNLRLIACLLACSIGIGACYSPGTFIIRSYPGGTHSLNVLLQLATKNPYIIGHTDSFAFRIASPRLVEDGKAIKALIMPLPSDRFMFQKIHGNQNRVKAKKGMQLPYDEMHVYLSIPPPTPGDSLEITHYEIMGFKVFSNPHSGRNAAVAGGIAGGIAVTAIAVAAIVATVGMISLIGNLLSN